MTEPDIDAKVLARLLIVNQNLDVLPDPASIAGFLCSGLQIVPGISDVLLCVEGKLYPKDSNLRFVCTGCATEDPSCRTPIPAGWSADGLSYSLPLRTARCEYGCLLIAITEKEAFEPYSAFLANTANRVAMVLEVREYLRRLAAAKSELETRVAQRTRDLAEKNRLLDRANRALRVLSACNQELIHAETESALLASICRIIVKTGGYRMAWVGFADQDPGKSVRPVAQMGYETGYLENARISWGDTERGRGPTGTAIRSGAIQINQDFSRDPRLAPWRAEGLKRGYQSSIALPLKDDGAAFGALTIYALEPDAFSEEEVKLLEELANDLAFGIVTLRARAAHRQAEEMVRRLAYFDSLTGLPNRVQIVQRLEHAIANSRTSKRGLAILTFDVNRFNDIVNGIGIQQADELTKQIGSRLNDVMGGETILARIGGNTFVGLLSDAGGDKARAFSQDVQRAFCVPFQQAGVSLDVQFSIGVAIFPDHGTDPNALLLRSNIAAREARASGTDFVFYSGMTDAETPRHLTLVAELRRAVQEGQLTLQFQPKIDLRSGGVSGAEALVRWQHPEKGLIPPGEFIPLAEYTGLIKPLTSWVMDAAFRQCADWCERGLKLPIAVNVSPDNLSEPGFVERIMDLQQIHGVDTSLLQLEITETALMKDPAHSQNVLVRLQKLGMKIFIDDFGSGYSSLSYIAKLPVYALKIDRLFIVEMLANTQMRSVVEASISLSHKLQLKTVAEGVDSQEQAHELVRMGCDEIQGFYFSRPVAANDLEKYAATFTLEAFNV